MHICCQVNELEEVLQDGVLQEIDLSNNDIGERISCISLCYYMLSLFYK